MRTTEIQKRYAEIETTPEGRAGQDKLADVRKRYLAQRETLFKRGGDAARMASEGEVFKRPPTSTTAPPTRWWPTRSSARRRPPRRWSPARRSCAGWRPAPRWRASCSPPCWLARGAQRDATRCRRWRRTAQRVASGDLTEDLRTEAGRAETALLVKRHRRHAGRAASSLVAQVRDSTDSIETASRGWPPATPTSARTELTASSLQETAGSMHQLTGTVRQSAEAARTANTLAQAAGDVAPRGGGVVQEVVRTMDEINASSRKISDIIGVIDGIAFQTNILALNAAVEAARAGEQGAASPSSPARRALAQRSAGAAREIKALIGSSVERVDSGAALVAPGRQTMAEIVSSVQRVTDVVNEISVAASEQSDGLGGVNGR